MYHEVMSAVERCYYLETELRKGEGKGIQSDPMY